MNKAYNYDYICTSVSRIYFGEVININKINDYLEIKEYIKEKYKDCKCRIFFKNAKDTNSSKDIFHKEISIINSAIFYK